MSHFNNILHFVVDTFKDLRDDRHCLTGPIKLERHTWDGKQYLFVSCEINILQAMDCARLSKQMDRWFIADGKLEHIIDVGRARKFDGYNSNLDPRYGIA